MIRNPYGKHRFTIVDDPSPTKSKSKSKSKADDDQYGKHRFTSVDYPFSTTTTTLKSPSKNKKKPKSPWTKIGRFSVRKLN